MGERLVVELKPETRDFYTSALRCLIDSSVPFMIGGAYAMAEYAGIVRDTKDLDVFCKVSNYPPIIRSLGEAGYETEIVNANWLAKAFHGDDLVDVIFDSSNGLCPVDDSWLEHAVERELWGYRVKLVAPEEMIWSKSFVQTRERFDGHDVAHILRQQGQHLDWRRLLLRMESTWELLLAQLMNFRFIYPAERDTVPRWLLEELLGRVRQQLDVPTPQEHICRGILLSRSDFEIDVDEWGYGRP